VTLALAHARTGTPLAPYAGEPIAGERRAPTFMLTDDRNRMFAYVARAGDPPTAFYFGYTRCPDACPLALAGLAHAHRVLPALRVLFVTIDPAYDRPAVLHRYLASFDSAFTGLTGTDAQVRALAGAFGVTALAGAAPEHDDTIVFVDRRGTALLRYRGAQFDPLAFADDVRRSDAPSR
jgi:protein SCO1/2